MKENETLQSCGINGKNEKYIQNFSRKTRMEETAWVITVGVDRRIILKFVTYIEYEGVNWINLT
jgi:hypothetical protein